MLGGDRTAEQICHLYPNSPSFEDSLLPADLDSPTLPPSGEDQFAIGSVGEIDNAHLSLYSVHINNPQDWTQGATFTGDNDDQLIAIATFTPACSGQYGGACVPQKAMTDKAESLGYRLMDRFAYWNDGGSGNQHWLVDFDVAASRGQNGVRWMEITAAESAVPPTALTVYQQGTYAPDGNWRWMGSMARDKAGDILVGYRESCGESCPGGTPMYPSIFVAGRLPSDSLGTLEPEVLVVAGTGSQSGASNSRRGYGSMRIDPDGCTFWYASEYQIGTQSLGWSTQIGSFKFESCFSGSPNSSLAANPNALTSFSAAPSFTLKATPAFVYQGSTGISTIEVVPAGGFKGKVDLSASDLPPGVKAVFVPNPVDPTKPKGYKSTLTFTVPVSLADGEYDMTIKGVSGALTDTTTIKLTVTAISCPGGENLGGYWQTAVNPTQVKVNFNDILDPPLELMGHGNAATRFDAFTQAVTDWNTNVLMNLGGNGITPVKLVAVRNKTNNLWAADQDDKECGDLLDLLQGKPQRLAYEAKDRPADKMNSVSTGNNTHPKAMPKIGPGWIYYQMLQTFIPFDILGLTYGGPTRVKNGVITESDIAWMTHVYDQIRDECPRIPWDYRKNQAGVPDNKFAPLPGYLGGEKPDINGNPMACPGNNVNPGGCGYFSFYSVMLHELGHLLGVGHQPPNATSSNAMQSSIAAGVKYAVGKDDPEAACLQQLYYFTLSAKPPMLRIPKGTKDTSIITSTETKPGAFDSDVALSATGQPAGVTVAFDPKSIAKPGAGTSTMTITVGGTTNSGTYLITVTGTGNGVSMTTLFSLTVP